MFVDIVDMASANAIGFDKVPHVADLNRLRARRGMCWVSHGLPSLEDAGSRWISRRSGTGNVRSEPCSPPTGAIRQQSSASFSCVMLKYVEICRNLQNVRRFMLH